MRDLLNLVRRLPVIRHIRYFAGLYRVNRHYEKWMKLGMVPGNIHRDLAVLDAIWRGEI